MSEHTKGPWYGADKPVFGWWTIYSNHSIGGTECLNGRQAIATIPAASKKNDPVYAEMFAANARLIAAAPDLLEALKRCKFDSLNMSLEDLEFCRAAYLKATEAQP